MSLLRRSKEKLKHQGRVGTVFLPQGYQESQTQEVNLSFTFYLVSTSAFPTVLDELNISCLILANSIQKSSLQVF